MIQEEISAGARVVFDSETFLAFCPFASQFPYEVWVVPKRHHCRFESAEDREIRELARTVLEIVRRIESRTREPSV